MMKILLFLFLLINMGENAFAQQRGKATFYTRKWDGRKTASGERLYNDSLVCAHKSHKFGTLLKVVNPANGKEVIVKVIDRGPYMKGRIIDLSIRAARELGILSQGVAIVEVSVYRKPTEVPYKPEDYELPEIELESTTGESIIPQWQDSVVVGSENKKK
ncbi:septal ring lytic transglycosylase RlpA family protein [Prevotella sp. tf2-5]|uniref:septal ring lytic transglycosylase RlpA family protein n=1 Tax=Prevotella sp. tf2-5 TaxID=1761889 RepID=UPI000B885E40|nr:septal ring lytic transglycosylase RlpA family protein [Prevotella sp. tf2-5]